MIICTQETFQGFNFGLCFTFQQSAYSLEEYRKEEVTPQLHVCFAFYSRFSKVLGIVSTLKKRKIRLCLFVFLAVYLGWFTPMFQVPSCIPNESYPMVPDVMGNITYSMSLKSIQLNFQQKDVFYPLKTSILRSRDLCLFLQQFISS